MSGPRQATFVLSTGRCGTQWLAHALGLLGPAAGRVEHEPLGNRYHPRALLGADGDPANLPPAERERIERHWAGIEATLEHEDYFEAGFPCWSALPHLCRRLAGRVRLVHLTRHPVPTAFSWVAHGAYVTPELRHEREKVLLHPADAGTSFPEYAADWPALHAVERGFFFWAEVHAFALRLEQRAEVPWLRVDSRELFRADGLERLARFLGLPDHRPMLAAVDEIVDEHQFQLREWCDPAVIARHPRVGEVARRLGYDPLDYDLAALKRRFAPSLA